MTAPPQNWNAACASVACAVEAAEAATSSSFAQVGVWERVWDRNKERKYVLEYDVLVAPHHCSWHSLSWDSWSDCGEDADVSADARDALGQARPGARIVASSNRILDDDIDPPCIRAKREYEAIAKEAKGEFVCVSDGSGDAPLEFEITSGGVSRKKVLGSILGATSAFATSRIGAQPLGHG
jgi:hypothetical protein